MKSSEDAAPRIVGVAAELPDEQAAYEKAVKSWQRTARLQERRQNQRVEFGTSPVAIAFVEDLGSPGVDYERVCREAQIIADTPGMCRNSVIMEQRGEW